MIEVQIGDSRKLIHGLKDKSIDCVVTSPPYWGLRDYKTEPIIFDGLPDCEHDFSIKVRRNNDKSGRHGNVDDGLASKTCNAQDSARFGEPTQLCSKCGAWKGQLGLEPTPELFIKHLLDFFDDVKLKLRDEGNVFVNLGDTYSGSGCGTNDYRTEASKSINGIGKNAVLYKTNGIAQKFKGLPAKCLCMIPQRFAWGMIERGWILRNEIIWAKPNHMPESVTDRLTKSHEVIYHFVKQGKYYYNLDAIREPHTTESIDRYKRSVQLGANAVQGKILQRDEQNLGYPRHAPKWFIEGENPESFGSPRARTQRKHQIGDGYRQGMNRDESEVSIQRVHEVNQNEIAEFLKEHIKDYGAMDAVFGEHKWRHWIRTDESGASLPSPEDWKYLKDIMAPWLPNTFDEIMLTVKDVLQVVVANANGKNPGDVWNITTQPYPDSHFAVFPLELVRRPILAGCPEQVCTKCGKARERIYKRTVPQMGIDLETTDIKQDIAVGLSQNSALRSKGGGTAYNKWKSKNPDEFIGYTDCGCNAGYKPGMVLDPFAGSGTVGEFCRHNDRNAILFELNPDYKKLIEDRAMLKVPELSEWCSTKGDA